MKVGDTWKNFGLPLLGLRFGLVGKRVRIAKPYFEWCVFHQNHVSAT
jgi:hypothetical protein